MQADPELVSWLVVGLRADWDIQCRTLGWIDQLCHYLAQNSVIRWPNICSSVTVFHVGPMLDHRWPIADSTITKVPMLSQSLHNVGMRGWPNAIVFSGPPLSWCRLWKVTQVKDIQYAGIMGHEMWYDFLRYLFGSIRGVVEFWTYEKIRYLSIDRVGYCTLWGGRNDPEERTSWIENIPSSTSW